jgi:hypothetical protein
MKTVPRHFTRGVLRTFRSQKHIAIASTVCSIMLERKDWWTDNGADDPRIMEKELSGMSGSPVFRLCFDNDRNLVLDLIGFIMANHLPYQDKLLMTSAGNILSTGKLNVKAPS